MASKDFMNLMTKLHQERYNVFSINISSKRVGDSFTTVASVVIVKGEEKITLQSTEWDFIKYLVELRGVADTTGEHKFTRVKDVNRYNADVEHLIDLDRSKFKEAVKEIKSGKFKREYSPAKLIDELFENPKNVKDTKFLPLKNDYHYILAAALIESNNMLKMQEMLIKKFPGAKKIIDATEIIMKSFKPTGNGIKDYMFYRNFVSFDIDVLFDRVSAQIPAMDDTIKELIRKGKVDADIAILRIMDIYSRMLELAAPVIDLWRIGLEIKRGVASPMKDYKLVQNIEILKSDPEYGTLFGCLDEQIRHSYAHASVTIDKANKTVYLIDARGRKPKIVRTYTFDDLIGMIQVMQYELFPALIYTLMLHEIAALDLVLVSKEYKFLLLALGN